MNRRTLFSVLPLLPLGHRARAAEAWPSRPITIVVPFVPGGPSDVLARSLSAPMGAALGQPVVVDNRPGGGGAVAAAYVARAVPDGHTLFVGASGLMTINPVLMPNPGYHPIRDFAPVTLGIGAPNVLVVHPSVPARTVPELLAWLRANPGSGSYGSSGVGSTEHLGMVLFGLRTGLELTHVPYRGASAAVTDLVAGTLKVSMLGLGVVAGQVRSGGLRAIATGGATSPALLPGVPPLEAAGLPGFRSESWHSIVAPAATPEPVVARLEAVIRDALRQPEIAARLELTGFLVEATDREALRARIASDLARWREVIREAEVTMD